MLKAETNARTG